MKQLSTIIQEHAEKSDFSGTVMVKKNGEVLVASAFGYSDRSARRENNIDTRYGIASGCKLFTAVAICQLV
ncbi:serine hydrolase, partial [Micrococcus sp. SIMBA_144]